MTGWYGPQRAAAAMSDRSFGPPLDILEEALGSNGLLRGEDMAPYLIDWRGRFQGQAAAIARPNTVDGVIACVKFCADHGLSLVPQSGRTGLTGASIGHNDRTLVLSLSRLNRIRSIDADNGSMIAEAGVILTDARTAAGNLGLNLPINLGSAGSAMIGGLISTNAGGTMALRHGSMRRLVLGLEVVLPDGRLWHGLRSLRKDNSGYDLKQMFIGSEGTLGVITAAALTLLPAPAARQTALVAVASPADALTVYNHMRKACGETLEAAELMPRWGLDIAIAHSPGCRDPLALPAPWYLLLETAGSADDRSLESALAGMLTDGLVQDATLAASATQAAGLWALREGLVEAQKSIGESLKHDIAVPVSKVPAFLNEALPLVQRLVPGIRPLPFGHIGDGNLHFNLSQPAGMAAKDFIARRDDVALAVHDLVMQMGGTFSAEHGIGHVRLHDMLRYKDPIELDLMRQLKTALDPKNMMNPGAMLPPTRA